MEEKVILKTLKELFSKNQDILDLSINDKKFFEDYRVFPIKIEGPTLLCEVDKDTDEKKQLEAKNILNQRTRKYIILMPVDAYRINDLLMRHSGISKGSEEKVIIVDMNSTETERNFNTIINDAVKNHATDIHISPASNNIVEVKIRVNGILKPLIDLEGAKGRSLINKFKNEAKMNIASFKAPESGSFAYYYGTEEYDFRIETIGSLFGQSMVIRILPRKKQLNITLEQLGFSPIQVKTLTSMMSKSYGLIIFTGPTGSGKTTTMHSALSTIAKDRTRKIITVEDPVEVITPGVLQIPVFEEQGVSMLSAIRSTLRMDPDVILIGEIRDREGAETVLQAAITGHLVLTTLHVNDVALVPERLYQFASNGSSINPLTISEALMGIVSQRLLTKIHKETSFEALIPADIYEAFEMHNIKLEKGMKVKFRNAKATGAGYFEGYDMSENGRTIISEVLSVDNNIREFIRERRAPQEIKKYLNEKKDHLTIFMHALEKVKNGEIDPRDVLKNVYQ